MAGNPKLRPLGDWNRAETLSAHRKPRGQSFSINLLPAQQVFPTNITFMPADVYSLSQSGN